MSLQLESIRSESYVYFYSIHLRSRKRSMNFGQHLTTKNLSFYLIYQQPRGTRDIKRGGEGGVADPPVARSPVPSRVINLVAGP
ncbi:hypothetical protein CEXT_400961 [Caerostris extrusa]|uniref:Ycf15 n=1 Tax=Caerostris extrusa TaxID=172846 RepID=A0AAV4WBG7_CAEEX|nr:hypothetical protein CEXT_400961 [Caerostris extrusa]